MKIIDEKGRIFGKINVIDFMVVLFLLCFVPFLYISYKVSSNPKADAQKFKTQVVVKFNSVIPELASSMKEGDILYDRRGRDIGVLKKIIKDNPSESWILNLSAMNDNSYKLAKNPLQRDLEVLFEIDCTKDAGSLCYNNAYIVKIGNNIVFTADLYTIQGVITQIIK